MKEAANIRKLYAFCLLLLFTVSITPKIYFHDVVANHKDVFTTCSHSEKPKACLHQQGYNCELSDPIISSPYLSVAISTWSLPEIYFAIASASAIASNKQECLIHKESRGPPQA
jgi:hypothetical protein